MDATGAIPADAPEYIELRRDETGPYGEEVVIDEGLSTETNGIVYYVPASTYTVKNVSPYPVQVNVFAGLRTLEDGASKWTGYGDRVLIQGGGTELIGVPDGWLVTSPSMSAHLILIPEWSSLTPDDFEMDDEVNVLTTYDEEIKGVCYGFVQKYYPNEDTDWDAGNWEWHIARYNTDNILDVIVEVPSKADGGESHQLWILFTPVIEEGVLMDGKCHFLGLDVVEKAYGFEAPDYYVFDSFGQQYIDERLGTIEEWKNLL